MLTVAPQALIAQAAAQVPPLEAEFVPNTIAVKLAPNSALLHAWQQQGRTGELSLLRGLTGAHSTVAYVDDGLLEAVQNVLRGTSEDPPERLTDGIARLCVVRLQSANVQDVVRLAAKLAARARALGLEYAEPMNVQRITSDSIATPPNDPLVGQQWHLPQIRASEAWRELARTKTDSSALAVAVIDTGVDYEHEDLSGLMWTNPGESGTDAQGRDRRSNGVDDDRNGKVDDWRGWDFRGADGVTPDNNPLPGNNHGTHVAGLLAARINNGLGGAGATPFVRIVPIKISRDNPSDEKVANGFEAMLYAASLGVRIINCSWRVTTPLQAEREITATVVRMGALVLAAGGNDGREAAVYPAAYQGVMSVSATASDDRRGGFANLDASVDIAAPGVSLYSTFPESRYGFKSGTSMATPLVAAAAALVQMRFPRFTAEQLAAQLKATSDNVDALNTDAIGRMGFGRVNALRAVRDSQAVFVECSGVRVQDANGNGRLESGEQVELQLTLRNLLQPAQNLRVQPSLSRIALASGAIGTVPADPTLLTPMLNAGNFQSLEERTLSERVRFRLPELQSENFLLTVTLNIRTAEGVLCGREQVTLTLNPSFVTMAANDLTVSVSNTGNIGFADPPRNRLGAGFLYKGGDNLLFEGALMVASGKDSI
jgi:subtilisin family serine protease